MQAISGIAAGFLVGLGAGTAVGMLVAPKRGGELRALIREKAMMARDKAKQQVGAKKHNAIDQARQALDKLEQSGEAATI